jgi:hypothetical protein
MVWRGSQFPCLADLALEEPPHQDHAPYGIGAVGRGDRSHAHHRHAVLWHGSLADHARRLLADRQAHARGQGQGEHGRDQRIPRGHCQNGSLTQGKRGDLS